MRYKTRLAHMQRLNDDLRQRLAEAEGQLGACEAALFRTAQENRKILAENTRLRDRLLLDNGLLRELNHEVLAVNLGLKAANEELRYEVCRLQERLSGLTNPPF